MLPATEAERRLADSVNDQLEPLKKQAQEVGEQLKSQLTSTAQSAIEEVKDRAAVAAREVTEQAQVTEQVRVQATGAGAEVADQALSVPDRQSLLLSASATERPLRFSTVEQFGETEGRSTGIDVRRAHLYSGVDMGVVELPDASAWRSSSSSIPR